VIVAKSRPSLAEVEHLIASEKAELAQLRKRREALGEAAAAEEKGYKQLTQRRDTLAAQLGELAAELAQLRGQAGRRTVKTAKKAAGRPKRRRQGKGTLRDAVSKILAGAGKPLRAPEIVAQLKASGYKTKSKDPVSMISATLAQTKDFRRVSRGLYTLAKSARAKQE